MREPTGPCLWSSAIWLWLIALLSAGAPSLGCSKTESQALAVTADVADADAADSGVAALGDVPSVEVDAVAVGPDDGWATDSSDADAVDAVDALDAVNQEVDQPQCQSSADCGAGYPYCDLAKLQCVACLVGGHCPGAGARCKEGSCQPAIACSNDKVCLASGSICDKASGFCVICVDDTACLAPQTCQASTCLAAPKKCATSKDCAKLGQVCFGKQCVDCSEDGECAEAQWCSQSFCLPDGCPAGAAICLDGKTRKSCPANGSQWLTESCSATQDCANGECMAKICVPGAMRCNGFKAEKCTETGFGWKVQVDCAATGQACLDGGCVAPLCKAGAKTCLTGGLSSCSQDLLSWGEPSPCPAGESCATGACLPWDCTPSVAQCNGQIAVACSGDGLSLQQSDCAKSGKVCESGICKDTFCKIGSTKCQGQQAAKCLPPGDAWTLFPCDDGQPCTKDVCDAAAGACISAKTECSDGNSCTQDLCDAATGVCTFVNAPGPCSAGDKCVLGVCSQGNCGAPVEQVVTIAGTTVAGFADGKGAKAALASGMALAIAPDGTLWIAERASHRIRTLAKDGTVTTVAGVTGLIGHLDGPGATARFYYPSALAVDKAGLVYVADQYNHRIRRIAPGGMVSTVAGSVVGYEDGPSGQAKFSHPFGIAVDLVGNLYVTDAGNRRIRKIAPNGIVTTVAGTGVAGSQNGQASSAQFSGPRGLALEPDGNLLITDTYAHQIRRLNLIKSEVSTFAGAGIGTSDGPASSATFYSPGPIALTPQGVLVFDLTSKRLRRILGGTVKTIAGNGLSTLDGPLYSSVLGEGGGIAEDSKGGVYFSEGSRIRFIPPTKVICDDGSPCTVEGCDPNTGSCTATLALVGSSCSDDNACSVGDKCDTAGKCSGSFKSCDDGNGCTVDFCLPGSGVCESSPAYSSCSDGDACTPGDYCIDGKCEGNLASVTTLAGQVSAGWADGAGGQAALGEVRAALWRPDGGVYLLDSTNHVIRLVKPDGVVGTYCGGGGAGYVDGPCSQAKFSSPSGLTVDAQGNLYVADTANHRIRKISSTGQVSTLAGSGTAGHVDGKATAAAFHLPTAMAVGPDGQLAVADQGNFRLRRVTADGTVSTLAGAGKPGKQDGPASSATFSATVTGLAYDSSGRLWVADAGNFAIRRMDDATAITTLNGAANGSLYGPIATASFGLPYQLAVAPSGMVYITDTSACKVRWLSPNGEVGTLVGAACGYVDGPAGVGQLSAPRAIALGPKGKLLIGDGYRVRLVSLARIDCDDGNACTAESCNKSTGNCSSKAIAEGGPCADADACTAQEICAKGSCGGGKPMACDDNNPCTADSCDLYKGCLFVPTGGPGCCVPTVWKNSFDTKDLNGMVIANSAGATKGWQINLGPPGAMAKSAPGVLWYGDAAKNLNQMEDSLGKATTPPIAIPSDAKVKLTCSILMDGNLGAKGTSDDLQVYLLVEGKKIGVWDKGTGIAAEHWYEVSLDLDAYAGKTVQVEFSFIAKAFYYTTYGKGVFIDDLAVTRSCN